MQKVKAKVIKRTLLGFTGLVLGLAVYGLLQLQDPVKITPISQTTQEVTFSGDKLLVASDADMVATAYGDAKLDRVAGLEDALTVIDLPLDFDDPKIASAPVSNSVMSWPQIIAVSPNGQLAYVVEVRSRPQDGIQEFDTIDEMPDGESLTVVDLSDPQEPKVVESIEIGRNPEHVSISPDGNLLAVNFQEPGRELSIYQLKPDGKLGKHFDYSVTNDGSRADNQTAIWHPSGKYLAMTQARNSEIGFYEVSTTSDNDVAIKPYGEPVQVGNHLSHPRFTSDGRFLLVTDLKWNTKPFRQLNFLMNPLGEAIAINFEPEKAQQPKITSRVEVGLSPEGFAVSPDDSLVATVNMRRTYLPDYVPTWRGKSHSSLSLLKFDKQLGKLTVADEYGFEGLLPEQVTFDQSGKSLAVVIYNYREPSPKTGAVEFWQVTSGDQPQLVRTGHKIDVIRGAHDIVLVP